MEASNGLRMLEARLGVQRSTYLLLVLPLLLLGQPPRLSRV